MRKVDVIRYISQDFRIQHFQLLSSILNAYSFSSWNIISEKTKIFLTILNGSKSKTFLQCLSLDEIRNKLFQIALWFFCMSCCRKNYCNKILSEFQYLLGFCKTRPVCSQELTLKTTKEFQVHQSPSDQITKENFPTELVVVEI